MTISVTVGGTEVATAGLLIVPDSGLISMSTCADGSSGDSGLRIDDPSGVLSFQAWDPVIIEEDACSQPRCFTGYVYELKVSRGPYTAGAGRIWELSVIDLNALLNWRVLRGASAKRSAETGSERLDWLMTTAGMDGVIFDNGQIMLNEWQYDEADYQGQTAYDVLNSIISASAVNRWTFFVYWDPTASTGEEVSLFYGDITTTTFDSTLAISNVAADVSGGAGLIVPPWQDADLTSDGSDIRDGVYVDWTGGKDYRIRTSTFAEFGVHRDGVLQSTRINNATTAIRHEETYLDVHAAATDTVTCVVRLPRSQVNLIEAGHRLPIRFSHLPGFESSTDVRVARRSFTFAPRRNTYYDVKLTMNNRGINQSGGGDPGGLPTPPPTNPTHWFEFAYTLIGDTLSWPGATNGHSAESRHFVGSAGQFYDYTITIATQAHPGTYAPTIELINVDGSHSKTILSLPLHGEGQTTTYTGQFNDLTPSPMATDDYYMGGGVSDGDHSMTHTATVTGWIDPVGWDAGGGSVPPAQGQWTLGEVVTLTGAVGATAFGYASGSLIVRVDGVKISTASYTETDPACGLFTLSWVPDADEIVRVDYQGA